MEIKRYDQPWTTGRMVSRLSQTEPGQWRIRIYFEEMRLWLLIDINGDRRINCTDCLRNRGLTPLGHSLSFKLKATREFNRRRFVHARYEAPSPITSIDLSGKYSSKQHESMERKSHSCTGHNRPVQRCIGCRTGNYFGWSAVQRSQARLGKFRVLPDQAGTFLAFSKVWDYHRPRNDPGQLCFEWPLATCLVLQDGGGRVVVFKMNSLSSIYLSAA